MNYSDEHKYLLGLPMRQGTRSIFQIFECLGFVGEPREGYMSATHELGVNIGKEDYTIIFTIRHPYKKYLSLVRWQNKLNLDPFEIYNNLEHIFTYEYEHMLFVYDNFHIDYFIDTENIKEDLLKIPLIQQNLDKPCIQEKIKNFVEINNFKEENKINENYYLTEEIKEKIYTKFERIFQLFNYQK